MATTEHVPIKFFTLDGVARSVAFQFPVSSLSELRVRIDGTELVPGADYSATGIGAANGGVLTLASPYTNGSKGVVYRRTELSRATDYQTAGDFEAPTVNRDFDRPWLAMMEMVAGVRTSAAALRAPVGEVLAEMPSASVRALTIQAYDAAGQPTYLRGVDSDSAASLGLDLADNTQPTRGAGLVGFSAAVAYAANTIGAYINRFLRICAMPEAYGSTGTADDSAAVQAAIDTGLPVHLDPGKTYTVSNLVMRTTGQELHGHGALVKLKAGASWGIKIDGGTYSPDAPVDGVHVKNLRLNMNSVANAKGIWIAGGWNHLVEGVSSQQYQANTVATSYELFISSDANTNIRGTYVSEVRNFVARQVKCLGVNVATNGVTTVAFHNLQITGDGPAGTVGGCWLEESLSISFYNCTFQQVRAALTLKNSQCISLHASYVEGCTTYLDATAGGVLRVSSFDANLSVTNYVTGSITNLSASDLNAKQRDYFVDTSETTLPAGDIFEGYVLAGTAGNNTGAQYWAGQVGTRNTYLIGETRWKASAVGPVKGMLTHAVNIGGNVVDMMVFDGNKVAIGQSPGAPTVAIDLAADTMRLRASRTPASSAAPGVFGEQCADATYRYFHNGTQWLRTSHGGTF